MDAWMCVCMDVDSCVVKAIMFKHAKNVMKFLSLLYSENNNNRNSENNNMLTHSTRKCHFHKLVANLLFVISNEITIASARTVLLHLSEGNQLAEITEYSVCYYAMCSNQKCSDD